MLWGFNVPLWISLICLVVTAVIVVFHVKYILPAEYDYLNRRDKVKMETLKIVNEIKTKDS